MANSNTQRASDPLPSNRIKLTVDVGKQPACPQGAVIGCPFPEGALTNAGELVVYGPAGRVPTSVRALHQWPDGSVRWALVAFLADRAGAFEIAHDPAASSATADDAISFYEDGDQLILANGRMRIVLAREGVGPIRHITAGGQCYGASAEAFQFCVDDASTLHGRVQGYELLEHSLLRTRVRLFGDHRNAKGERRLSYRVDVELWAGSASPRIDYQFMHLEPGAPSLEIESMRFHGRLNVGDAPVHHFLQPSHGLRMQQRLVRTADPLAIRGDWSRSVPYLEGERPINDETAYPDYLINHAVEAGDWLGVTGGHGGAFLRVPDMLNMRPKRLAADGDAVTLEFWPREAGPMTLPQGRSRRQTFTLSFARIDAPLDTVRAIEDHLRVPLHEGRATLDPQWLRAVNVFDQGRTLRYGRSPRFERYLNRVTTLELARGMFDHGDAAESGYFYTYSARGKQPRRPGVAAGPSPMRPDCPDAQQRVDTTRYEPVWANNEYDLIHALSIELMRTGRRDLWATLHAAARHNIEVDFVAFSDDPWQHHGSPAHSAHHNLASSYPSHLWTQGLLEYHCLTGDPDALEVAIKLGRTIVRNLKDPGRAEDFWGFNREIGWSLLALVQIMELTGDEQCSEQARELAEYLANYDRKRQDKPVKLSSADPLEEIHGQIASAFFGYASMVEAMDRYARLTQRDDLGRWLCELLVQVRDAAARLMCEGRLAEPLRRMVPHGMAIGYERTGDTRFLDVGMAVLESFFDSPDWIAPPREVKPSAMIHRSLVRFLHHIDTQGMLPHLDLPHAARLRATDGEQSAS